MPRGTKFATSFVVFIEKFVIDNQCFSLKKVGNSKYVFYTLSKRPLLTYLTFFYWCSGFIWVLWVQKYKKSLIIRTIIRKSLEV